jgi:3-oxoacyl-[acyl-carrier protein] reductase
MSQVTLVTGAAGGIGRDLAAALAERGAPLVLADIDHAGVEAVAAKLRPANPAIAALHVDITSPASARAMVAATLERFGRLDNLVHCAGIDAPSGRIWEQPDEDWTRIIDADLSGAFWCCKAVLPPMLARGTGRIVLIGSVAGRSANIATSAVYNAAKAGINGLAIGLSTQVEAAGIRVNVVAPGPTGTGNAMTPEQSEAYRRTYPLGEGGTRPVVEACLYLLGPGGDWMSGSVVNISGGRWRG